MTLSGLISDRLEPKDAHDAADAAPLRWTEARAPAARTFGLSEGPGARTLRYEAGSLQAPQHALTARTEAPSRRARRGRGV